MALVKRIACKLRPVSPYLLEDVLLITLFTSPCQELHLERFHLILELLPHRLTKLIRLPSGEVCDLSGE